MYEVTDKFEKNCEFFIAWFGKTAENLVKCFLHFIFNTCKFEKKNLDCIKFAIIGSI